MIYYLGKGMRLERNLECSEFYNLMVFIFFAYYTEKRKKCHNI